MKSHPDLLLLLPLQMQEYPRKHLLEAGLRTSGGRWTKDDVAADMDDIRMME